MKMHIGNDPFIYEKAITASSEKEKNIVKFGQDGLHEGIFYIGRFS